MSRDRGTGPVLNISIDSTGAESGAQRVSKAFDRVKKKAKELTNEEKKLEDKNKEIRQSFRNLASSIAIVDGPLGGVASRVTAFGSLLGRVTPKMVLFAAAGVGIAASLRLSLKAFVPYERGLARLESVLFVTGRQAEITAGQLDDFAVQLGKDTLTSRQAVIDAASSLATFSNIASDSFERILTQAQDLSALFGGDLRSNTLLLARALQSPAEAFTILQRRIGRFTEEERRLLKALVETGDILTAQEVIFSKLASTQGAAAAEASKTAGSLDTLGESVTNLGVQFVKTFQIVEIFNPIIKSITFALSGLEKAFQFVIEQIESFKLAVIDLSTTLINNLGVSFDKLENKAAKFIDTFALGALGIANSLGIVSDKQLEVSTQEVISRDQQRNLEEFDKTLLTDVIPSLQKTEKQINGVAQASQQGSQFISGLTSNLDELELAAERIRFGGITEEASKFREELERIAAARAFELRTFGITGTNLELEELRNRIMLNKEAFDELGASGQELFNTIENDIIRIGELQEQQRLTEPIDNYVRNAEFGLRKVNELIVQSSEIVLDALTKPYEEGETAGRRWRTAISQILREVAREIIRTQIIARSVGFLGNFASSFFGSASSIPTPVLRPSSKGNVFDNAKIIPHAAGGVIDRFSAFPMAGGNIGTIAEGNRAEAILPLKRNSAGQLGVISTSSGGGMVVNNNINVNVSNNGNSSPEQNENLARTIAKQIEIKVQQEMAKVFIKERRSGGQFNNTGVFA